MQSAFEPTSETKKPSSLEVAAVWLAPITGYVATIAGVLLATAFLTVLRRFLNPGDESLLYLPVVIVAALRFGFGPAVFGALFSFCCWDYFFDVPYYALTISNAHDFISLVMYLAVAVTIARLTSRAKIRAREAEARERETAMLYQASSAISCEIDTDRLLLTLVEQIVYLCRASLCIVYLWNDKNGSLEVAARSSNDLSLLRTNAEIEEAAVSALDDDRTVRIARSKNLTDLLIPLDVQGRVVGVLFVGASREGNMRSAQEERLIMTLANHAAVVIARQSAAEASSEQAQHTAVLDERNRLARDVHDTLSHTFTGIKFLLEAANRVVSPEQAQNCIVQARSLAVEGAQEARRSVLALRPAALEEAGTLIEAIKIIADQKATGGTVKIETRAVGLQLPLRPAVEENLLRIAQEAMTNALRHARATRIIVTADFSSHHSLKLTISDDGIGFDPEDAGTGFGLTSMKERAALINGLVVVRAGASGGADVIVQVPLILEKGK